MFWALLTATESALVGDNAGGSDAPGGGASTSMSVADFVAHMARG